MIVDFTLTVIVLIGILGLLVFIHELGHFLAAKLIGVEVEEFAFGFGKILFSKKFKDTLYRINLIPLGGYVKVLGDEDASSFKQVRASKYSPKEIKTFKAKLKAIGATGSIISQLELVQHSTEISVDQRKDLRTFIKKYVIPNDPDNIQNKGFWGKLFVYVAGVFMNMLIAVIIFTIFLALSGFKTDLVYIAKYPFIGTQEQVVNRPIIGNVYNQQLVDSGFEVTDENFGILLISIDGKNIVSRESFEVIWNDIEGKEVYVEYMFLNDGKIREEKLLINSAGLDLNIEPIIETKILVISVKDNEPAKLAGLKSKDLILTIDGLDYQFDKNDEFSDFLETNAGQIVQFEVLHPDGQIENIPVTLNEKLGDNLILGATFQLNTSVYVSQYHLDYSDSKPLSGFYHAINIFGYNPVALAEIFSISFQTKDVELASQSVSSVWGIGEHINTLIVSRDYRNILNTAGLVSVALAFMNILPIPLLDGGQVLFLFIEKIRGKPLSEKKQETIAKYSFLFLIILSVLVVLKDIWLGFVGDFLRGLF